MEALHVFEIPGLALAAAKRTVREIVLFKGLYVSSLHIYDGTCGYSLWTAFGFRLKDQSNILYIFKPNSCIYDQKEDMRPFFFELSEIRFIETKKCTKYS